MQNVFYRGLDEFCQKYLIRGRNETPLDLLLGPARLKYQEAAIFEQILLFDRISLKVFGDNIPLAVLFNALGEKALDELIEQEAIHFVLWTPLVTFSVTEMPGIDPLQFGNLNSPAHCDPEKSIELGLDRLATKPVHRVKRALIKKIAPLYVLPPKELAESAVKLTNAAFNSNKLLDYGLSPLFKSLQALPKTDREALCNCASELLEYSFLIQHGMTSYSDYRYYKLFSSSVQRIQAVTQAPSNFNKLAKLEGMPDLKALCATLDNPLAQVPKLRAKRSSVRFRQWLASVETAEERREITREYIDAIANARGLFDSAPAKFTKSIVMTAVGVGAGAAIGGGVGALLGAGAAKLAEPAVDLGLDLLDTFLLEGLTKGWTPRLFFDDLRKLEASKP